MITLLGEVDTAVRAPGPWLARRRLLHAILLLLKHKTEGLTSCTPVPNGYSQYFSTKLPTVYYT